jgi:hypothetical protein
MTVDHDDFARAGERPEEHEEVLSALPCEALRRDGKNIRRARTQGRESLTYTARFEFAARDRFNRSVGIEGDEFGVTTSGVAAERDLLDLQPRKLPRAAAITDRRVVDRK